MDVELDWTKFGTIPNTKKIQNNINFYLKKIKKIRKKGGIRELIVEKVKSKSVLDIGAIEHGYDNMHKHNSLFFKIEKSAKRVTGLDIIEKDVELMKKDGYDFICMDATSNEYLGKKFDIVNIGDVIEHVDNPVALLKFAKRHLNKNGEILVTTPNPYYIETLFNMLKNDNQICNFEHISWLMPCFGLEIARRAGLKMSEYYLAEPATNYKRLFLFWLPLKFKSSIFLFVFKK